MKNVPVSILKKRNAALVKKALEYKSTPDLHEDKFIEEEGKKQKEREMQQYI